MREEERETIGRGKRNFRYVEIPSDHPVCSPINDLHKFLTPRVCSRTNKKSYKVGREEGMWKGLARTDREREREVLVRCVCVREPWPGRA